METTVKEVEGGRLVLVEDKVIGYATNQHFVMPKGVNQAELLKEALLNGRLLEIKPVQETIKDGKIKARVLSEFHNPNTFKVTHPPHNRMAALAPAVEPRQKYFDSWDEAIHAIEYTISLTMLDLARISESLKDRPEPKE